MADPNKLHFGQRGVSAGMLSSLCWVHWHHIRIDVKAYVLFPVSNPDKVKTDLH